MMKNRAFWLLCIFAVLYILGNIATGSLATWDEAVYANISGNIVKTGDWLILHQGSRAWFDKPPLYMWCTAVFYKLFGISEFSARLTSGLFGLFTVLLVYMFAKRLKGDRAALLASLILLAAPHFLQYSKMGMMDVTLTFFITLMLYLFWKGQDKPYLFFWSWIAFLLAYLTKGIAAAVGPAVIFLYCILSRNLNILIKREFLIGAAVSIFSILIWHLIQFLISGPVAVNNYFGFHVFKRTLTALEEHSGGINFYQKAIFNKNKPWGIIYYPAIAYILWFALRRKDRKYILFCAWIAVVFVIWTLVRTKLHWYIIPIYPAIAISSALFLDNLIGDRLFHPVVAVILIIMLIQVPISWAFKLDFNHKAKEAAVRGERLQYEDDGTIFYYRTVNI